jgi:predicted RNA-binding Zn-ribbon protein involved in translation (DUF1610 family)
VNLVPAPLESPPTGRQGVLAALPLLLFAVGAFLLAVFFFKSGAELGSTQAPLWSLFAALGAVTTGGGVAVVGVGWVEGAEPVVAEVQSSTTNPPRPSTPPQSISLPLARPIYAEDEGASQPPVTPPPYRAVPILPAPRGTPIGVPSVTGPSSAPPPTPARFERTGTEMERALVEMQATLEDIAAEGRQKASKPETSNRRSTSPDLLTETPASNPPPGRATRPPTRPIAPAVPERTPILPTHPASVPGCVSCGARIENDTDARPCVECGHRLCWMCELKTLEEGRYLVCDKCSILSGRPSGRT